MKYRLTIEVEYDPAMMTPQANDPAKTLGACANYLAGEGMLSGENDLELLTWDAVVEKVEG